MSINLDDEIAMYKAKMEFYKNYPVTTELMIRELWFVIDLLEQIKKDMRGDEE